MAAAIPTNIFSYLVGPHLAGASVGAVFLGVVFHQFSKYLSSCSDEPLYRRVYVCIAVFLTTGSAALEFAMSWEKIILAKEFLGDPDLQMTGTSSMSVLNAAFIAIYVQSFYLHRLFMLSKRNWYLVAFLGTVLLLAFALSLAAVGVRLRPAASDASDTPTTLLLYNIHFAVILVGDLLLTLTTVGYLVYYRKKVLPQSAGLFKSLIIVVFQSAAPATFWIVIEFAFCVAFPNRPFAPFARVTATLGMNLVLNKLWAISLLATLNSRRKTSISGKRISGTSNGRGTQNEAHIRTGY
ncbi:hypothetical protein MIND_01407000 [Mycena indigotica]|uniref:DUF6534 domain-containing protein n=1 Tax=Mycena indigotica TaxID=2126181 RepID=A0A8H6S099_9AGAR|nr:uncharacterized protein MIND_01407000 [Mycena indigotica]KAF7288910.1 hypothetical protein MIND_01407000 [Mycena indigotica]